MKQAARSTPSRSSGKHAAVALLEESSALALAHVLALPVAPALVLAALALAALALGLAARALAARALAALAASLAAAPSTTRKGFATSTTRPRL